MKIDFNKEKITTLRWFDILAVTLIMFGNAIYNSTLGYIALFNETATLEENLTFTTAQNYQALINQSGLLLLAIAYLLIRRFDFGVFASRIKLSPWLPIQVIALFLIPGLAMDIYYYGSYYAAEILRPSIVDIASNADFSLVIFALLNGFYEEIFFLGVCLAVKPEHVKRAFLYSLVIRCSFHTYQGLMNGIALGLILGIIFFALYKKIKPENMLPFFLAHAIADIVGLSAMAVFW